MSQFRIDPTTSELVREGGSFQRVEGPEEYAQHLRFRLRMWRGECPFDLTRGTDWPLILRKGTPESLIEQHLADVGIGTPGVASVDDLTLTVDRPTRQGSVTFSGTIDDALGRRQIPLHDTFTVPLGSSSEG